MMVSLWFIAIGVFSFSGYRIHNYVLSRRAHKRYNELSKQWNGRKSLHDKLSTEFYSWASVKDRGYLLPDQVFELEMIMDECRSISQRMAECAEEF